VAVHFLFKSKEKKIATRKNKFLMTGGPTAKSLSTWAFLFSTVYFLFFLKENGGRKKAHVSFEILAVGGLATAGFLEKTNGPGTRKQPLLPALTKGKDTRAGNDGVFPPGLVFSYQLREGPMVNRLFNEIYLDLPLALPGLVLTKFERSEGLRLAKVCGTAWLLGFNFQNK